ncbi:carboxymuconolactone decarboxylase family protein [Alphaproteobacteria bacterium]|nr:carboxymuconolactone decarboxylase family protein [Alphaproteobacteria bacterium]
MSRLPPADRTALSYHEDKFKKLEQSIGFIPQGLLVMGSKPAMLTAWAQLVSVVYHEQGLVAAQLKRMIAHTVSRAAGCHYSMAHTAHAAVGNGVEIEKIKAVFNCTDNALFSNAEQAALIVARQAGQTPNDVSDSNFDSLREYFSEAEILEIIAVIALFGFLNRWQATLALTLEDAPRFFAETHLTDIGWNIGRHS